MDLGMAPVSAKGDRVTNDPEVFEALPKAFLLALLLTGGVEAAEAAVLDAIAAFEVDYNSAVSLLSETVKSAIRRPAESPDSSGQAFSILPLELRRLLLLGRDNRHCFVVRLLLGMTPEIGSGLLNRSVREVEEALRTVLQTLPATECLRPPPYGVNQGEERRHPFSGITQRPM